MDFYNKLPRNKKENLLFMLMISFISVNIIGAVITGFEAGFNLKVYLHFLTLMPIMWVAVIVLISILEPFGSKMANRFLAENDSFNAKITVTILFNVVLMSFAMSMVGTWIGTQHFGFIPLETFLGHWGRNFGIAFAVEGLIAQPIARFVLLKLHQVHDADTEDLVDE